MIYNRGYGAFGLVMHSIQIKNRYLVTTGGYDQTGNKVEIYDVQEDQTNELANVNEGRYRHSSCHFNNRFIYIFSGRSSESHRQINSIESFDFDKDRNEQKWTTANLENNELTPRIWSGSS